MTFFPSVDEEGHLLHVFHRFQKGLKPLLELHDDVLRGPSDLSIGERELIAAFVSALNDCCFCFNAHRVYAAAFGIEPALFDALIENLDKAPIEQKLKPLLAFVKKLTNAPARMLKDDADAVFAAGWSEDALHDAVLVASLFNFMNRIIFAHGLDGNDARYAKRLDQVLTASRAERDAANSDKIDAKDYAAFGKIVATGKLPD